MPIAEVAIQPIGISNRDNGDPRIPFHIASPAISNRITGRYLLDLENGSLQCAYRPQSMYSGGTHPIQSNTQPDHIHLIFRETFDTGCIQDMFNNRMLQPCFQISRSLLELRQLLVGKVIENKRITSCQM